MNKTIKLSAALLALGFAALSACAQSTDAPSAPKDENIIIHKKGNADEKLTIVVDGDKVTVNGKPLSDFKDDDVQIISDGDMMPPMPPMRGIEAFPPHGGAMAFKENFMNYNKAFLGVMSDKTSNGIKITNVTKGSPAEKAGLQNGDVITKAGSEAIATPEDLYKAIGQYNAGDKVDISYRRNDKTSTTSATLDKSENNSKMLFNKSFNFKMPEGFNKDFSFGWSDKPRMGIEVQDTEDGNGVKITDVNDDDAPAAKAGLKEGDIITLINGKNIKSTDDLKDILKDAKEGDNVSVQYLRDGKSQTAQVKFPKELKTTDL